jgi:hypothetical protein
MCNHAFSFKAILSFILSDYSITWAPFSIFFLVTDWASSGGISLEDVIALVCPHLGSKGECHHNLHCAWFHSWASLLSVVSILLVRFWGVTWAAVEVLSAILLSTSPEWTPGRNSIMQCSPDSNWSQSSSLARPLISHLSTSQLLQLSPCLWRVFMNPLNQGGLNVRL